MTHTFQTADDHQTASATDDLASENPEFEGAELYARVFRTLGDPTRVRILHHLLNTPSGECNVSDLTVTLQVPQSRVSTHLGCLRWCGLVQARRDGKQVFYRVADSRIGELLALGGALLRDHAAGIATCELIRQ